MAKKTTFIWAIEKMQDGKSVKRNFWGDGNARSVHINQKKDGFIMIMRGGGEIPWSPSNADIFSDDWEIHE